MSDWRFELAKSSDLSRIGELTQIQNRSLTMALNRAGSFTFETQLTAPLASSINEVSTCVVIYFQNNIFWSGPVWTIQESTPNSCSVGCVGWLQTLEKRITKVAWGNPLVYTSIDAGTIAFDLLTRSNADSRGFITAGANTPTQVRTRTYQPYSNVLQEIQNLTEVESGFDMNVDPSTRLLNIYSKYGSTNTNLVFELGNNVESVSRSSDSSKIVNDMTAYSAVGSIRVIDQSSINAYGGFEEAASLSDVVDTSILGAYSAAEVDVRSYPLRIYSFVPFPYSSLNPTQPRFARDWKVGDTVNLSANKGRMQVQNQAVRIFSATVSFTDSGFEQVTNVQTTAA